MHTTAPSLATAESAAETDEKPAEAGLSKGTLLASIVAAIAASTCCLGPLVLLTLGVSGSWIGSLSAMAPFRPYLMGLTLLLLGLAFRKLYRTPQSCAVDAPCASPANLRRQRVIFWVATVAVLSIMAFPWYGPWLLD